MKVALIGGTGYVGSYITDELINNGHTLKTFSKKWFRS